VLLANYWDITLLTNSAAFELGRRLDIPFTPHYTHIELILNGRYEGSYVVTEQIQAGRGRVEIDDKAGFLVELDAHYDDEPKFRTPVLKLPVMIKHPKDLDGETGYDFVKNAVNELEAAMFSDPFPNADYRDLIDMDNFVDVILVNEITRNEDFQAPQSVYLYREGKTDTRLRLGPLWDFDDGFGYDDGRLFGLGYDYGRFFNDADGMYYNRAFRGGPGKIFFGRFFEDPCFRAKYRERWNKHYPIIAGMETFIDQMGAVLDKSQQANHRVWRWRRGVPREETERMKTWWKNRIEYLNFEINSF
jgi:spore coat protein CotH